MKRIMGSCLLLSVGKALRYSRMSGMAAWLR